MSQQPANTDILILGAGIAGLWLNARLQKLGYRSLLVDPQPVGSEQSGKSQGIIHGGTKYALQGMLTGSSEAIAEMPQRWRNAFKGEGELDLRNVQLLSETHYLWSPGSLASNLTSFFASKAMRGRVTHIQEPELPQALHHPKFQGRVYGLAELVVQVPSLLEQLLTYSQGQAVQGNPEQPLFEHQQLVGWQVAGQAIRAHCIILTAGSGNATLLAQLGEREPAMQTRPLHMVAVKSSQLSPLYAHCLGSGPKPRITITSHPTRDGQWVWYLGGELAEAEGVRRTSKQQIAKAKEELSSLLPWLDLTQAHWQTLRIDRAEPAQSGLIRPDNAFLARRYQGRLLVGWPTKLALAPHLSDLVLEQLQHSAIQPKGSPQPACSFLPSLGLAPPFWESFS